MPLTPRTPARRPRPLDAEIARVSKPITDYCAREPDDFIPRGTPALLAAILTELRRLRADVRKLARTVELKGLGG